MFLSDKDIEQAVKAGVIKIEPFEKRQLQPASYDIRLGNLFVLDVQNSVAAIDPAKNIVPETRSVEVPDGGEFILQPGMSVLGYSKETLGSKDHLVHVSSKSSLARVGLFIHNTTGLVNPGHFLCVALLFTNLNRVPIVLRPGMAIAQLTFTPLSSETKKPYKSTLKFLNSFSAYAPPRSGPLARARKRIQRRK